MTKLNENPASHADVLESNNKAEIAKVKKQSFPDFIKSETVQSRIESTLGDSTRSKRFVASLVSAVTSNKELMNCQAETIVSAALLGETLDLSPSPQLGHYYIVPYDIKDSKVGTFQLGYKGYIQLAIRSAQYKQINVIAVKEGELKGFNPLTEEVDIEFIDNRDKVATVGYLAYLELTTGFRKTIYWTKEKMDKHAVTYSKAFRAKSGFSFWEKNFDEMAFKTMLRQLISKWGIMSIDLQNAFVNDMALIDSKGNQIYLDNDTTYSEELYGRFIAHKEALIMLKFDIYKSENNQLLISKAKLDKSKLTKLENGVYCFDGLDDESMERLIEAMKGILNSLKESEDI